MADAAKIVVQMERRRTAELEQMAEEAMRETDYRMNEATHVPIKRRGRRVHRVQKLSLIALAAQRKYLKRQIVELVERRFCFTEFLEADVQDLISVKEILLRSEEPQNRGTNQVAA